MSADKDIKPAEIQDEELNEVQGGLRIAHTGVRVPETTPVSGFKVDAFQDGDDLVLRKRPGRLK